ncbi:hypothetical protein [Marinobacterium jannaschii]|uniref:hypothetical protein n=1 Tax=Marinobacterium jannaschii TaxID=64970 RepID=UPI0012EBF5AA|nr:hypothetical protein [Marinobacterium jannaschii]
MAEYSTPELMMESDFIWREIAVGDHVMVEADIYDSTGLQLKKDRLYQVLAKMQEAPGNSKLIVESDVTGALIDVHPALLCSYESATMPVQHS